LNRAKYPAPVGTSQRGRGPFPRGPAPRPPNWVNASSALAVRSFTFAESTVRNHEAISGVAMRIVARSSAIARYRSSVFQRTIGPSTE
jgi:hypothetical protein